MSNVQTAKEIKLKMAAKLIQTTLVSLCVCLWKVFIKQRLEKCQWALIAFHRRTHALDGQLNNLRSSAIPCAQKKRQINKRGA